MDHQGHGLALEHPIFHEPNAVELPRTRVPRPPQYLAEDRSVLHPDGVGETLELFAFETGPPASPNPILVNHEGFFTDVPGFENLAEGNSEKILGSLSLARQGRWFYWGYSIDPARTTRGAQDLLVNVLYYMRGKRDSRTVEFVCKTRRCLPILLDLYRRTGYLRGIEEHLPGSLTPRWRETYEATPEGCAAWLDRHLPYVFSGKGPEHRSERYATVFEVDEDAEALGTPNAERASLERWIELATAEGEGEGEARARAERCLARYVHPDVAPSDGDWRAWYARMRDRIVFVESTGFWWQEDSRVLEREAAAAAPGR